MIPVCWLACLSGWVDYIAISPVFSNSRQTLKFINDRLIVRNWEDDANSFAIGVDDVLLWWFGFHSDFRIAFLTLLAAMLHWLCVSI